MAKKITLTNEDETIDLYPETVDTNVFIEGKNESVASRLQKTSTFKTPVDYEGTVYRDADRLGGELPSFFAKEEELNFNAIPTEYKKSTMGASISAVVDKVNSVNSVLTKKINSASNVAFNMVVDNLSVTFSNGIGYISPSLGGKTLGYYAFAQVSTTTTSALSVASCKRDGTDTIKIDLNNRSYNGDLSVNIMYFLA